MESDVINSPAAGLLDAKGERAGGGRETMAVGEGDGRRGDASVRGRWWELREARCVVRMDQVVIRVPGGLGLTANGSA